MRVRKYVRIRDGMTLDECPRCGHARSDHVPACLVTIRERTNRWGGGFLVICGCPDVYP